MFEIFVYSPRFEGVHLRGKGRVAPRRPALVGPPGTSRTEVLGLVKAQMVKNTVIVPVGAKGGFVLKKPAPRRSRPRRLQAGVACYQDYLRGLLDLTDNLRRRAVVPPPAGRGRRRRRPVPRRRGGQGHRHVLRLSPTPSARTASGWATRSRQAAVGYDHKAMGITARGAWESVKRHFREMGVDIQTTDFTVVGIGDMSGDVFGNGMLLSKHIRLVAAFDHRHIFLDPTRTRRARERERLFRLPRSSWADYDAALCRRGGGVWSQRQSRSRSRRRSRPHSRITAGAVTPPSSSTRSSRRRSTSSTTAASAPT